MTVVAKFYVNKIEYYSHVPGSARIGLAPVYASTPGVDGNTCEENRIFGKYTPSGEIWMMIENPDAVKQFKLGKPYYVHFDEAEN